MLIRIHADNYRSLVDFDCSLSSRQLILGSNGSGKSSLFDVLSIFRDLCGFGHRLDSGVFASRLGPRTRTRWQDVPRQTFELDVVGNGGVYRLRLVIEYADEFDLGEIIEEEVSFDNTGLFKRNHDSLLISESVFSLIPHRIYEVDSNSSAFGSSSLMQSEIRWIRSWLQGLLVISPDPRQMSAETKIDVYRPNQTLANFADWYRRIKMDEEEEDYITDLAEIFDGFIRFRLEDMGDGKRQLKACFFQQTDASTPSLLEYSIDELSDGQRILIGLYAILHFALRPGMTLCFDEPDNFIALREIQPWLDKVFDRTGEDDEAQVLFASHHPGLLNKMAYKQGLLLERPDGRQTRARPFGDPASTGLSAAELVARGWES